MAEQTADELRAEIASLERKAQASLGADGKPMAGYRERLDLINGRLKARTEELTAVLRRRLDEGAGG